MRFTVVIARSLKLSCGEPNDDEMDGHLEK